MIWHVQQNLSLIPQMLSISRNVTVRVTWKPFSPMLVISCCLTGFWCWWLNQIDYMQNIMTLCLLWPQLQYRTKHSSCYPGLQFTRALLILTSPSFLPPPVLLSFPHNVWSPDVQPLLLRTKLWKYKLRSPQHGFMRTTCSVYCHDY